MDERNERLGKTLKRLTRKAGVSLRELEEASGVHRTHLSKIELGHRRAKPETLVRIAAALDIDAAELLEAAGHTTTRCGSPAFLPALPTQQVRASARFRPEAAGRLPGGDRVRVREHTEEANATEAKGGMTWQQRSIQRACWGSYARWCRTERLHSSRRTGSPSFRPTVCLNYTASAEPGTPDWVVTSLPFIEVVTRSDMPEGTAACVNWFKPRWLIQLNRNEPAVRRRFSLMHEFKHVLDHGFAEQHGRRRIVALLPDTRWQTSEERSELAANYFAACLLMPKRLIKRRFHQGVQHSYDLAGEFGVSEEAIYRRLEQLGLVEPEPRDSNFDATAGLGTAYFRRASGDVEVRTLGGAA